ncbi:hypothetical protein ACIBEA_38880 [Streptomyces sp. NPDC051555]|uniref:hypothetical protein n=1 Tax=Streptomyces sp. NPDC051555 TaxID=3365657 RepID=UPI0037A84B97
MTSAPYPPAPKHLRAACGHPDGHLTSVGSRATLQVYLDDHLVYRDDADGYRLAPAAAQDDPGGGPYIITGAGRRALLNSSQCAAIDSANEDGALGPEVGWPTAVALARLGLVEYRDTGGGVQPNDGDDGHTGPKYRPWLTRAGVAAVRAAPPQV